MNKQNSSWSESYNTGIREIDEQHQTFVAMLDKIDLTTSQPEKVIDELEAYILKHFAFEEMLLFENNYEQLNEHLQMHQRFVEKVTELKKEQLYQNKVLLEKIITFIRKWFISHIIQSDMKYRDYIRKQDYEE